MDEEKQGNLWKPAEGMSPRIKKLRDEYFSFYERDYFRNEVIPFTTATQWDQVWTPHNWGVVPEMYQFFRTFQDNLLTLARPVKLPDEFWENSLVKRRAIFFREILEKCLPVKILNGELIVGSYFNTALSKCLDKKEAKQWKKEEAAWIKQAEFVNAIGIGNAGAVPGHIIPNYAKVVKMGLKGIYEEIEKFRACVIARNEIPRRSLRATEESEAISLGTGSAISKLSTDKRDCHALRARNDIVRDAPLQQLGHNDSLDALQLTLVGARNFAQRYSAEAKRLAQTEADPERKKELEEISRVCSKVPWEKPANFYEAVQAVWFCHLLIMAQESYPGPGLSPGRIDQYLYPLYKNRAFGRTLLLRNKRDLDAGRLTREQAKEILECYWIKHNYAYDYQARVGPNQGINSGFGQLITLSGMGPAGQDLTNALTWLIFDVLEAMNLLEPKPNVRIHKRTPDNVLRKIVQMIIKSQGSPFLLNFDENSMKGLEWEGLPKDGLWNYAPVGCLENTLQGNMLSADTLKKAQCKPEEYKNLLVRVTGYNAYFVCSVRKSRTR